MIRKNNSAKLILLDAAEILKKITNEKINLVLFESIDSTNEYLKMFKGSIAPKFCLAEQQTKGRGRLNRHWHSPFGENVYLSCLYPFQKDVSELAGLSLVMSLAILKTLKTYHIIENVFVKWPNDIIYIENKRKKKLSGCLIEIYAEAHDISDAIIGMGINVNMLACDKRNINQAWTSMQKILGCYIDRNELTACLINNLLEYLSRFNSQGFSVFIDEWMEADCLADQIITLKNVNKKIKGKVTGINAQGHLLLELANGKICAFSSGDTSVEK